IQIARLLEASRFSSRGSINLLKRRVALSSSSFFLSPRIRFRFPTNKRSPRNHTVGLGFGPVLAGDGGGSRGVGSETNIDWERF
ncbi:unnamed protein product, partial [Musa acuminata var. zebrina]